MDLHDWSSSKEGIPGQYSVDRVSKESDIPEQLMECILANQREEMFKDYMRRRLAKGAALWFLKKENKWIGYFWVFIGQTMKPHFIPLMAQDVHIFDGFIFPEHRGQGEMAIMMNLVVDRLRLMGLRRAYIETAEWNTSSIKFIEKMGYTKLGYAKQRLWRGKNKVTWSVE
jgi:RimJ/RimL family protein N-acetyltransferase